MGELLRDGVSLRLRFSYFSPAVARLRDLRPSAVVSATRASLLELGVHRTVPSFTRANPLAQALAAGTTSHELPVTTSRARSCSEVLCHHFSFFSDSFADVVAAIAIGFFFFREPFPQSGFFSFR